MAECSTPVQRPPTVKLVPFPSYLGQIVSGFLVDKRHGNIILNVRDGQIMKVVIEETFKA